MIQNMTSLIACSPHEDEEFVLQKSVTIIEIAMMTEIL